MKSCWRAKGIIIICIRRGKAEACGCRRTAEDNKIAHAVAKACAENTENPCLADFGGTWVLCFLFNFFVLNLLYVLKLLPLAFPHQREINL